MTTAKNHVTVRAGSAIGVVKKVLLAGCMLGVGLVVGTFLIGHQIYSKVGPCYKPIRMYSPTSMANPGGG